ncbi:hypothetical protein [Haloarchaeobius sp. HRN-SO-5]|uniref:hypothetical protein n=1 Tax=Haloarchaeobius sp. HRN-SO-5 TaxID=3446118 RepID=UPI003EC073F7
MTLQLYTLPLPRGGARGGQGARATSVAAAGTLSGSTPVVEDVASQPGDLTLEGVYRGTYAAKMARELDELGSSSEINTVALFDQDQSVQASQAGYYVVESVDTNPERALSDRLYRWRLSLRRQGTQASHWRAVQTAESQPRNDFGNDTTTAYIGIPATASKVRWYDAETGAVESASVATTRNAEYGDVDMYDTLAPSFSAPTLLFEVPYRDEEDTDLRVWDTRGNTSKTDGNGYVQWAKVFDTTHDPSGSLVVDNGLLRLTFDDANNSLGVEQWDDSGGSWTSVSLGTSDWQLFDTDLRRIGQSDVRGRVEFEDPVGGSFCTLTMSLQRGFDTVRWLEPTTEPTPSGLVNLLSPIANTSSYERSPSQTVTAREEVQ